MSQEESTPNDLSSYLTTKNIEPPHLHTLWKNFENLQISKTPKMAKTSTVDNLTGLWHRYLFTKKGTLNKLKNSNSGLANIVNKLQVTINQNWESFHKRRTEEAEEQTEMRKQDDFRLAAQSFLSLVGFVLVLAVLTGIGLWLTKKCKRAKKEKKQKEKQLSELQARLKALEDGGEENENE